jgi:hypothetical protein
MLDAATSNRDGLHWRDTSVSSTPLNWLFEQTEPKSRSIPFQK